MDAQGIPLPTPPAVGQERDGDGERMEEDEMSVASRMDGGVEVGGDGGREEDGEDGEEEGETMDVEGDSMMI